MCVSFNNSIISKTLFHILQFYYYPGVLNFLLSYWNIFILFSWQQFSNSSYILVKRLNTLDWKLCNRHGKQDFNEKSTCLITHIDFKSTADKHLGILNLRKRFDVEIQVDCISKLVIIKL